jgi:hypothetical protein
LALQCFGPVAGIGLFDSANSWYSDWCTSCTDRTPISQSSRRRTAVKFVACRSVSSIRYVIVSGFGGGSAGAGMRASSPSRSNTTIRRLWTVDASLLTGSEITSSRSHDGVIA